MSDSSRLRWRRLVRGYVKNFARPGHADYWSPSLEKASRGTLRALQGERLASAYAYLWNQSLFYREKFQRAGLRRHSIKGLDDLQKIPLTHREEWVTDQEQCPPWGTFSPLGDAGWHHDGWMLFTTSGTTSSRPRVFRHTSLDRDLWAWIGARAMYSMGVRNGDVAINCFGYGTSVAFWGLHYALTHMGVPVIPGGGANSERRAFFIRQFRPTVLLCTPSYALYLGRVMEESGMHPRDSSIRLIVSAGEPGPCIPSTKRRIEELWGAELHDDFGCTEVAMAPLGYTCRHQVRQTAHPVDVHLMEDVYIPEVIDPDTLQPVPEGERGILVVSNLFSEAQPILRYVMGDWISVTHEPCPCGRTHARAVGGLQGRNDDLIKVRGLIFFPSAIEDGIRAQPDVGDEFRVEISREQDLDRVKVSVEPRCASASEPADLTRRVARNLRGLLGIDVDVELLAFGTLPRTEFKARRLVDLRRRSH